MLPRRCCGLKRSSTSTRPTGTPGRACTRRSFSAAASPQRSNSASSAVPLGPVQLVVRAVGYRGVAVDGLPFDERSGTIPHSHGRIEGREHEYVVGWIKRGPSGVIGSNKKDSADTVETLLADLGEPRFDEGHAQELHDWLLSRQPRLVTDAHWERIDAHERAIGEAQHRPRVKVSNVEKLLGIAHG